MKTMNGTSGTRSPMQYEYIDDSDLEDGDFEDDTAPKSPMDITSESEHSTGGETPQSSHLSDQGGSAESRYSSALSNNTTPAVDPAGDKNGATETNSPTEVPLG